MCLDPVCLGILVIVPCATVVIILDSNDSLSNVTLHLPNVPPQSPMLIIEELDFLECVSCRMVMGLRSQSMPFKWHTVNDHQALLMTLLTMCLEICLFFYGTDHCLEYTLSQCLSSPRSNIPRLCSHCPIRVSPDNVPNVLPNMVSPGSALRPQH